MRYQDRYLPGFRMIDTFIDSGSSTYSRGWRRVRRVFRTMRSKLRKWVPIKGGVQSRQAIPLFDDHSSRASNVPLRPQQQFFRRQTWQDSIMIEETILRMTSARRNCLTPAIPHEEPKKSLESVFSWTTSRSHESQRKRRIQDHSNFESNSQSKETAALNCTLLGVSLLVWSCFSVVLLMEVPSLEVGISTTSTSPHRLPRYRVRSEWIQFDVQKECRTFFIRNTLSPWKEGQPNSKERIWISWFVSPRSFWALRGCSLVSSFFVCILWLSGLFSAFTSLCLGFLPRYIVGVLICLPGCFLGHVYFWYNFFVQFLQK